MNAIVDTLKTAFPRSEPQSPTDDLDPDPEGKLSTDKKAKYENNVCNSSRTVITCELGAYFESRRSFFFFFRFLDPDCDSPVKALQL